MTPQSSFLIVAPIKPEREAELRRLLDSMNHAPGRLNLNNPIFPFPRFEALHVGRFLVIEDRSLNDITVYGIPARKYPLYLGFAGDLDGDADQFLEQAARDAKQGLQTLFGCCDGFSPDANLAEWMKARNVSAIANYVNWRGRTVRQVREEATLHEALQRHIDAQADALASLPPGDVHKRLRNAVDQDIAAGRLTLSPERPTPTGWWIRNLVHLIALPLVALLLLPALIVIGIVALIRIRMLEKSDPELCERDDAAHAASLALIEDHDVANQFSAMGSIKPMTVRLALTWVALTLIDYGARHIYKRGGLARVRTIHFARWVFLDNYQRVIFMSNYDGSLESYMDDFINKVGFGLNLAFGNGIGYPRVNWLIKDGCQDERKFKEFLRRHQMPTQVWYRAYPGLTAVDLERNARIREGLMSPSLTGLDAREWVALL